MRNLGLLLLALVAGVADAGSLTERIARKYAVKATDTWCGGNRTVFDFQGHEAWVVEPAGVALSGKPWTWTMQWWGAFVPRTAVPRLIAQGYHHIVLDMFDTRASDAAMPVFAAYQRFLVEDLGLAPKALLIGMSWGGFFSTRYAATYPQNVARIFLDCPLLNFDGFSPSGTWAEEPPADGDWSADPRMPVNLAEPIAKAGIPILLRYGGQDRTVTPAKNAELFIQRFKAAGGNVRVIKDGMYGHHPHGFEIDSPVLPDFLAGTRALDMREHLKGYEPPVDAIARIFGILRKMRKEDQTTSITLYASGIPVIDREVAQFADGTNVVWAGAKPVEEPRDAEKPSTAIGYFISRRKDGDRLANNEWLDHIVRNRRQIEESKGEIDLVFCGDSITHCWESRCPTILKEIKSKHSLLLAGFSGDRTEHLLWRLKYGELDGYRAKSVMLLIGTNNSADTPEKIAAGVKACLNVIREKQPQAKVVLMAIFPRRDGPQGIDGPKMARPEIDRANEIIRTFADGRKVVFVDIGKEFLDKDDDTKWIMPDRLHPQTRGFEIWYDRVKPYFDGI